jgi:hypothetical protein
MLLLVTELTVNDYSVRFLSAHGNEEYFRYHKKFMLSEREKELSREVNAQNDTGKGNSPGKQMRFKAEWYRENECNARKNGAGK